MSCSFHIRRRAKADLSEVVDYLALRSPDAAENFAIMSEQEFKFLAQYPGAGTRREKVPKRLKGLRSWPIKGFGDYLIFYLPGPPEIEIVRVLHGARHLGRIIRES